MYAKQSTAKTFLVGPILDADGVAKTDEVVASIKVTKNGSVGAPNGSSTLTHNHTGHYLYAANAGDVDTLGQVEFSLNSGTNAMAPVRFQIISAAVYASLIDSYSATRGLAGTALPAVAADGAGGLPISDAGGLDLDTKLANTNEVTAARMGALTDWIDGGRLDLLLDAIPTTAMRGTDSAALATVCTEARLAELDAANLPADIDAIPTTAMRGTDGANTTKTGYTLTNLSDANAAKLEDILDGTGGTVLTLNKLRIVASDAAGAIDIDNDAGTGINVQSSSTTAIVAASTGGNSHGVHLTGSGNGRGLYAKGGNTGDGIAGSAGDGGGNGIRGQGINDGAGMALIAGATGSGLTCTGGATSGHGIAAAAATDGNGIDALGAGNGDGIEATGIGAGDGIEAVKGASGYDIDGDIHGTLDTCTANSDMRGTDGANTTVPDAAGTAAGLHTTTDAAIAALENLSAATARTQVDDALIAVNLDHLCKTATVAADMTAEVVDNTILSRILANGDTSAFVPSTDGLQAIRDVAPHGTAMRGTDSANTTVWDAAGTAAGLHSTTDGLIGGLNDPTAAAIVTALFAKDGITAGGSATFEDVMKAIYAAARGQIDKDGDDYSFKDDDDSTPLFTLTMAAAQRTTA